MRRLAHIWREQSGAAAIEFAIIGVVLVALSIATVDFGRTLYVKNQLSWLADQATRKVLVDPDITDATLESELRASFTAGNGADLTVSLRNETVGSNAYRVLEIDFPLALFIPGLSSGTVDLNVTRRVPTG